MATGVDIKDSTDESDERNGVRCLQCLNDGTESTATSYCVDCEINYCSKCLMGHNLIPATRSHHVNDIESSHQMIGDVRRLEQEKDRTGRPTKPEKQLTCLNHPGKPIDTYCKDHNDFGCQICVVVHHRSCQTKLISAVAKGFRESPKVEESRQNLRKILAQFNSEKDKRTNNVDVIDKKKLELIEYVDKYEEKFKLKVTELANIARNEIRAKHDEYTSALKHDVEVLNSIITTATEFVDNFDQVDDIALFTNAVSGEKFTNGSDNLLQEMSTNWKEMELEYIFDEELESTLDRMKSLGRIDDKCSSPQLKATFERNIDVKQTRDSGGGYIFDMLLMPSDDLLVTDHNNKKLKRFNAKDLLFRDEVQVSGNPIAVCKINQTEVAVRIWNTKVVHLVAIGQSMQLQSSFTLGGDGHGMAYDETTGEILACEGNKIGVYDKTGNHLRSYQKKLNGENIFSQCRQIILSDNRRDIYVTDDNKGLIVLDKQGNMKRIIQLSEIPGSWPLCTLPGHKLLVGSRGSGTFVQTDEDGKQTEIFINNNDGRSCTYCAVYDRKHSRLLVGGDNSVIFVYTLSQK